MRFGVVVAPGVTLSGSAPASWFTVCEDGEQVGVPGLVADVAFASTL